MIQDYTECINPITMLYSETSDKGPSITHCITSKGGQPLYKGQTQDEKLNFLVQYSYSSAEVTYTFQVEYHVSWR